MPSRVAGTPSAGAPRASGEDRRVGRAYLRGAGAALATWAMIAGFAGLFIQIVLVRHWSLRSGRFDLGNMVQAVWTTGRGEGLLTTTSTAGEQFSRLGSHVDPILVLFAPLSWFLPTAELLLVSQVLIVALGALPVFWLGRRWLGDDRLAVAGAAVYLLYPTTHYALLFDFHPVTLATPLLVFCIWAAETARWWTLGVVATLAMLTKEQVGLSLAVLGLWLVFHHRRRIAGTVLSVASLAWVTVAVLVILPRFALGEGSPHLARYAELGDSEADLVLTVLTRPWEPLGLILGSEARLTYLLALLLPLLGLSLLAPFLAAGALPELGLNLLSGSTPQHMIEFHYAAVVTPFLIASALLGLARLRRLRRPAVVARALRRPAIVVPLMIVPVIVAGLAQGPLPWSDDVPFGPPRALATLGVSQPEHAATVQRALDLVPDGAAVSATNNAAGDTLSERERLLLFPFIADADYIVIDSRLPGISSVTLPDLYTGCLLGVRASPAWEPIFSEKLVHVYRRDRAVEATLPPVRADLTVAPQPVDPRAC